MKKAMIAAGLLWASTFAQAGGEGWTHDFEAAKKRAAAEGKDLLIDFTGSDWCGWCKKLDKEVFSQEPFKASAAKEFVLVELDFPRGKALPPEVSEQNQRLKQAFRVQGFPTIFLADAEGRPYARTGYQQGGAEKYVTHLDTLQAQKAERDALFAKARAAQGVEKARFLDQALVHLEQKGIVGGYEEVVDQIIALDADNAAGLKAKYAGRRRLEEVGQAIQARDLDGAMAKLDAFIREASPTGDLKQRAYFMKAFILGNRQDMPGALEALKTAHAANPEGPQAKQIEQILAQLEAQMRQQQQDPAAQDATEGQ